jgi:Planctomycete cytochrome C
MKRHFPFLLLLLTPAAAGAVDFKRDIAPIFKAKCYECHSEQAKKEKNGYVFDNLKRLADDIRPSGMIDPGRPDDSPIMELITLPEGDKRHMPPKGSLTVKEVKLMRDWIAEGASLEKKSTAKPSALPPKPAPEKPVEPAPEQWISTDGKAITAVFVSLEGEVVVLKMNGKPYRVPLEKLSEASRKQATQRKP